MILVNYLNNVRSLPSSTEWKYIIHLWHLILLTDCLWIFVGLFVHRYLTQCYMEHAIELKSPDNCLDSYWQQLSDTFLPLKFRQLMQEKSNVDLPIQVRSSTSNFFPAGQEQLYPCPGAFCWQVSVQSFGEQSSTSRKRYWHPEFSSCLKLRMDTETWCLNENLLS